jgi:hypothetical protein
MFSYHRVTSSLLFANSIKMLPPITGKPVKISKTKKYQRWLSQRFFEALFCLIRCKTRSTNSLCFLTVTAVMLIQIQ